MHHLLSVIQEALPDVSRRNDAYEAALAALRDDTQAWWANMLTRMTCSPETPPDIG